MQLHILCTWKHLIIKGRPIGEYFLQGDYLLTIAFYNLKEILTSVTSTSPPLCYYVYQINDKKAMFWVFVANINHPFINKMQKTL